MTDRCTVTALYNYPVKSCRGTSVDEVQISPTGIEGDRQLMIIKDGKFSNQKRLPKLAQVITKRIDGNTIEFSSAGNEPITHKIDSGGEEIVIDYYTNMVPVIDQGIELAEWVSLIVGHDVRVVALKSTFRRTVPLEEFSLVDGIDQSRFVDVAPILVTNTASLHDLNSKLDDPITMNRFRPNVVIEGLEAFAEDRVNTLEHGQLKLIRATYCERCAITCTDQETGERNSEPLNTLKSYRHRENGYAGGVMFGSYMGVEGTATLRVGDTLTIA